MLKDKPSKMFMLMAPLVVLIIISGYLTYITFTKYQKDSFIKNTLQSSIELQTLEYSVLNEQLCRATLTHHTKKIENICKKTEQTTDNIFLKLQENNNAIQKTAQNIVVLRKQFKSKNIDDLVILLEKNKHNEVVSDVFSTLKHLISLIDNAQEKEILQLYSKIANVSYATEVEKILVTYYLSKKVPISSHNFIYWDKIIAASNINNLQLEKYNGYGKDELLAILSSQKFTKTLDMIDTIRVKTLYASSSTEYNNNNVEWITLLRKKQKNLQKMEFTLLYKLNNDLDNKLFISKWLLFMTIFATLLGFVALLYQYRFMTKKREEDTQLLGVANHVSHLESYASEESSVMNKMLHDIQSKSDIYNYIKVSFDLLNEKNKQLRDEVKSKEEFLSTLSHEIRTPLSGIIGFTKLLKEMGIDQDKEEFLSLIETSSNNLITIANDILNLSKINAEQMDLENISFDIFEVVETTVSSFVQLADQKDIELGLFIDPFMFKKVMGDSTKISQILTNLIGNAIKFTEPYGKINIFLQCVQDFDDSTMVKFAVHDTGIGLSEEEQKNIFKPYKQASQKTNVTYGGTGLGLTISSKMVELMNGKLKVESEKGKGSTFFFTITLAKDPKYTFQEYPDFNDVSVGMALPVRSIKRQLDTNLEIYIKHLGASFSFYYYDELFENNEKVSLPDIMIFDHHYARLSGELEQCSSISCKSVLLTVGSLYSRINPEKHHFTDILMAPITLNKTIRILRHARNINTVEVSTPVLNDDIEAFFKLRVLVADDNMINRKLIQIILEKLGLDVTLVENGEEAVKSYKDNLFDIIFMDIQMPIMDGVEATKAILEYEREEKLDHVPIIALTANASPGDKDRYLNAGMDDYATKPLDVEVIKSLIHKYCSEEIGTAIIK